MGGDWKILMRNLDDDRHPDPKYVGPGKGWNYPDILLVGIPGGLNEIEERTQFSMWAIVASPLFLGNDLFNMPQYAKEIVTNKEVIAIDQDPLGIQGDVVKEYENGKLQVWSKQLKNGSKAIGLLNRDTTSREIPSTGAILRFPENGWSAIFGNMWTKASLTIGILLKSRRMGLRC